MNWSHWLVRLLVAILILIVVVVIVGWAGGFDWHFAISHFHWDMGVTKGA